VGGDVSTAPVGDLPTDATSFVGRRQSIANIRRMLTAARLVTLTGVGGVGKTRLALRVATELRRSFADGAWLVDLSQLRDAALVTHTVRESLRIPDETGRSQLAVLADHLGRRQLLLVLDNCEHLVDACAQLVDVLLRGAPGLRVLATSREPLGVIGEHVWQVPSLAVPDPQRPMPPGAVSRYSGLALFAERAAAADPDFVVTSANEVEVAKVCHLLDGIPLAIELAAVGVRELSLSQLLSRLTDCYRLLSTGRRGGVPRHQTLQAAVGWSYDLCSMQEQTLWQRASVFAGGFDLPAADHVCAGDGLTARVLELVICLVDKSVLIREEHGGRVRYRLLETLRQYGRNKLRELGGEAAEAAVRRRHRDYYLRIAEQNELDWFGPAQEEIFVRTRLEHANLRVALDYCLATPGETRTGLHLASTLWFYWAGCGLLGEGRLWLDRALTGHRQPGPERAKALWVNGYVATLQGELAAAVELLEECRRYARDAGDDVALAYATHRLGCRALVGDNVRYAITLFEEAETRYVKLGELNSNVMLASIELAIALIFVGDLDRAAALCERARVIGERHGERWAYAYAVHVLALVALSRGEPAHASAYARDCLRIKRTFHDLLGIVLAVEVLAWTAAAQGAPQRAATLLGAADQLWPSVGYPLFGSKYFGAPHHDCEQATRRALGERAFTAAFQAGVEFELAETIAYALDEEPQPTPAADTERDAEPDAEWPARLTRREGQVAELIAEGLSNKEIAARLLIRQRTAESHVEHILRKLGVNSRAQIAAQITHRQQSH